MSLTSADVVTIVEEHRTHDADTGSPEVQVSLLQARIQYLTEHFQTHRHDHTSRRGLFKLVGKQRRQLRYLYSKDAVRYRALIAKLGIRDRFSPRAG